MVEDCDHSCALRHLEYDFEYLLSNYEDFQYFGEVMIGSHQQKMDFLMDTGSDWIWIPSSLCPADECPGDRYEYE
jgi:hypothetical protein